MCPLCVAYLLKNDYLCALKENAIQVITQYNASGVCAAERDKHSNAGIRAGVAGVQCAVYALCADMVLVAVRFGGGMRFFLFCQ